MGEDGGEAGEIKKLEWTAPVLTDLGTILEVLAEQGPLNDGGSGSMQS